MYWFRGVPNFGDVVSPVIVEAVSGGTPVRVSDRARGKLLAVGSIMHHLSEGDSVWGAGAIRDQPISPPRNVKFHAVRGPLTRSLLRADVPEIYGDPAMLLPSIYPRRSVRRFDVGVVPHYLDRDFVHVFDTAISVIDVQAEWRDVVERITECEVILSSSLHGLIVAEAYGVPAVWMTVTDKVAGEGFKFRDYYLSTGREAPEPLAWNDALGTMARRVSEPPRMDIEPLLRAWPEALAFRHE